MPWVDDTIKQMPKLTAYEKNSIKESFERHIEGFLHEIKGLINDDAAGLIEEGVLEARILIDSIRVKKCETDAEELFRESLADYEEAKREARD